MKEFSFICISYNQQKEIVEHLESIRQLVERFGGNTENDLIVADDGSADGTAAVAREWIGRNRGLFRRAEVLPETANMGTVRNIYRAIDSCRTENFKILAGDDKYNLCDIYALYDSLGDDIVITPVLPFGNFGSMGKKLIESFRRSYRLTMAYNKNNNIGELILFRNYLLAPGVFTPSRYWRDSEARELLHRFRYIEDTPLWMKLIYERRTPVRFEPVPYIFYRIDAEQMLSSQRNAGIREQDDEEMRRQYPQRLLDKRKFFRPSFYRFMAVKTFYTFSDRYDGFFKENPEVKRVYYDLISR